MTVTLYQGDCLEVMRGLPDGSVDSVITDPPAGIGFMGKEWDSNKGGRDAWIAWLAEVLAECLRVAKPGAMLLCWALPRTSHWTGMAIEQAGWEVRDRVTHIFGSGFPKSLDIGKAIDKASGAERAVVGMVAKTYPDNPQSGSPNGGNSDGMFMNGSHTIPITAPATPLAQQWDGWGTALKPAAEDWWLAMKPLDGTFAQNAARHGVAGLWIDGSRIGIAEGDKKSEGGEHRKAAKNGKIPYEGGFRTSIPADQAKGRWPANLILDEAAAAALDEMSGERPPNGHFALSSQVNRTHPEGGNQIYSPFQPDRGDTPTRYSDTGGASRFFYCAKASRSERNRGLEGMPERTFAASNGAQGAEKRKEEEYKRDGIGLNRISKVQNHHPTVKPLALLEYLCTLTRTPTGGVVLDPFMGSGTTGVACVNTGRGFIGIDDDPAWIEISRRRIEHAQQQARQLPLEEAI